MHLRNRATENNLPKREGDDHVKASPNGSKTRNSTKVSSDNIPTHPSGSDCVADSQENQCALNSDVLGHLFSFLALDSLQTCRLVSKTWNEEASRQLGHTSWFKIEWKKIHIDSDTGPRLSLSKSEKEELQLTEDEREEKGKEEIQELLKCLTGMYNPSVFSKFEFDFEWLLEEKFQELLEDFGTGLKRITIRDRKIKRYDKLDVDYSKRMEIVFQILTKWCPKLISFQMEVVRETSQQFLPEQLKWVEPNNLRELRMEGVLTQYQADFWIQLIKTCPYLSTLSISCVPLPPFWDSESEEAVICESFFEELSKLPEVTKNLKEFSWDGGWFELTYTILIDETSCNILKPVSNMDFSNKLKKIGIGLSIDSMNGNERCLTRLLRKLNAYGTEEIVLSGKYRRPLPPGQIRDFQDDTSDDDSDPCECAEDNHNPQCLSRIDHIPSMSKIKSIKSSAKNNYQLGIFHSVHKFPNLTKYDMSPNFQGCDYPRSDDFAPELHYLSKFPHYNLRTLIVSPPVNKPETLECIMKSFPNLTSLEFDVGHSSYDSGWSSRPPNKISFKEAIIIASKCEHLKELTVSFMPQYSPDDLCEALGVVKDFPSETYYLVCNELEFLTLNCVNCKPKISFERIQSGLSHLSNLKTSVCLVGFKVTRPFMIPIMEKYCEENQIRVEFIADVWCEINPYIGSKYTDNPHYSLNW